MSTKNVSKKEALRIEAHEVLLSLLEPGMTVYTNVKYVSSSGMSRSIQLLVPYVQDNGTPAIRDISYLASKALGWRFDEKREAVKVSGCGMDMGFHTVYSLSRTLFSDKPAKDSGYLLKHSWI